MACLRADIGYRFIGSVVSYSNRVLYRNISRSIIIRGLAHGRARVNSRIIIGDLVSAGNSPLPWKKRVMADPGRSEYREEEKKSPYTLLVVAVALIDTKGRVLLAERPTEKHLGGLYEFPGGKVEAWESPEAALVRELDEELGIRVKAEDLVPITFASHAYQDKGFHLLMPLYGELFDLVCCSSYAMYITCIVGDDDDTISTMEYSASCGLIQR